MIANPNQLWLMIQNQLPEYIRHDASYSQFLEFLQSYFSFVQEQGSNNPVELIANQPANMDIDTTIDLFVSKFTDEFLEDFPIIYNPDESDDTIKAQKRAQIARVVTHVKDIYIAKGAEAAFRALFRVLYGEEIEFFYPKTVVLKASDGRWTNPISVKVRLASGDMSAFDLTYGSATLVETSSLLHIPTGASATVESIVATQQTGYVGYELFLSPTSLKNPTKAYVAQMVDLGQPSPLPFADGNTVTITLGTNTQTGTIKPVPTIITLTADANGPRSINDTLTLSGGATDVVLDIKSIKDDGTIKAINIINSGYTIDDTQTDIKIGSDVVGEITIGGITHYPGVYSDIKGFLSDQTRLRGPKPSKLYASGHAPAEYYQEFSYVIRTALSISVWGEAVKKILHPAGYVVFGDITIRPDPALIGVFRYDTDDINLVVGGNRVFDSFSQNTIVSATKNITGVEGLGVLGTMGFTVGPHIVGVEALGELGVITLHIDTTKSIGGVAGHGSLGGVTFSVGPDELVGVEGLGALGTMGYIINPPDLVGVAGKGRLGFITLAISAAAKTDVLLVHGVQGKGAVGQITISIS